MMVRERDMENGSGFVAAELVGAGVGDEGRVVSGRTARYAARNGAAPIDAAIVGIIDTAEMEKKAKK
jgi:ethanolamine utilization protein EutN